MLRRVEVAHAQIVFGEDVPVSQRRKCNAACLSPGQEVRITACQDSAGEWRAKRVEILRSPPDCGETTPKGPNLYQTLPTFVTSPDNRLRRIQHRIVYGRNLN